MQKCNFRKFIARTCFPVKKQMLQQGWAGPESGVVTMGRLLRDALSVQSAKRPPKEANVHLRFPSTTGSARQSNTPMISIRMSLAR